MSNESRPSIEEAFRAFVLDPRFVCVAGKSAVRNDNLRLASYADMPRGAPEALPLARDLLRFIDERRSLRGFSTFVAAFEAPIEDELELERRLWQTLQALHDVDTQPWDPDVSAEPESDHFSFSFGGCAFFVIGLHPASSRLARRFAYPALVFNAHEQFEALRREGKYERLQAVIRARDVALQGEANPNLATFGERSEAIQYSGRRVEADWRCPFHRKAG